MTLETGPEPFLLNNEKGINQQSSEESESALTRWQVFKASRTAESLFHGPWHKALGLRHQSRRGWIWFG